MLHTCGRKREDGSFARDSSTEFGERMQKMRAIREEQTSRISAILSGEQRAKYQKDARVALRLCMWAQLEACQ